MSRIRVSNMLRIAALLLAAAATYGSSGGVHAASLKRQHRLLLQSTTDGGGSNTFSTTGSSSSGDGGAGAGAANAAATAAESASGNATDGGSPSPSPSPLPSPPPSPSPSPESSPAAESSAAAASGPTTSNDAASSATATAKASPSPSATADAAAPTTTSAGTATDASLPRSPEANARTTTAEAAPPATTTATEAPPSPAAGSAPLESPPLPAADAGSPSPSPAAAEASPPASPAETAEREAATAPARANATSDAGSCLPPRSPSDTTRPFCFQPDTISAQARQFLATQAAGTSLLASADVAAQRTAFAAMASAMQDAAARTYIASQRNTSVGGVPVLVSVPKGVLEGAPADTRVVVYLHGGGYTVGSCHYQLSTVGPTAAAAQLVVMCPEYRLAPEHPFPAGLNDALTMYKSLLSEGYRPGNIVLLGDSAGGGLVAAMAVQLAREGVGLPAALGMFSPWADLERGGDTGVTMIGVDPLLATLAPPNQSTDAMPSQYVGGDTSKFADPLVSPLRADYVALFANGTLPPTLIQVGLRELLLSHAVLLYHKMALAAPTPGHVVISPYEGMWHVFQMFNDVPEAQAAAREMAAYFSRALSGGICT